MFGFRGGVSIEDARREWPFLTRFDCSSIETEGHLRSMVRTRSGISEEQASRDVDAWMEGERFWAASPVSRPEQEGGA